MFVPRVQDPFLPVPIAEPPKVRDVVQTVAIRCFQELGLSVASGALISFFVAPPGIVLMMSAAAVQLIVSAFFQSVGAFLSYKRSQQGPNLIHFERGVSVCEWLTGINFAILTGYNTQNFIHESGHALASLLIYKRPQPLIEIYPFVGGLTQFYKTGLSNFGKSIGSAASTFLVVASGPGLTLLISSALLAIGIGLKEKYPELSKYLISWSVLDFFCHAQYAYSALRAEPWNLAHDFVHLSIFGLDPIAAAIGIVAIPVLISIGTNWWLSRESQDSGRALIPVRA